MKRFALVTTALVALAACGGRARTRSAERRPSRFRTWIAASPVAEGADVVTHAIRSPLSLLQIAGVRVEINPSLHDPLTALGACADLVTRCYQPPGAPLDACVDSVRRCTTATPWREPPCCPVSCSTQFHRARAAGTAPMEAFEHVYLDAPTCIDGVAPMIAEATR